MNKLPQLGLGTYTNSNSLYDTIPTAIVNGYKLIDTAPNYFHGNAQNVIRRNIQTVHKSLRPIISTKVGFFEDETKVNELAKKFNISNNRIRGKNVYSNKIINYQVNKNLTELGVDKIDFLLIHNPELHFPIGKNEFYRELGLIFYELEKLRSEDKINFYGIATWNGLNIENFDVTNIFKVAFEVGGINHGFRAIQCPISLVNINILSDFILNEKGVLKECKDLKISVLSSSPFHGGKLIKVINKDLLKYFDWDGTVSEFVLNIPLSVDAIDTVLVGASSVTQIEDNILAANQEKFDKNTLYSIIKLIS